jgi:hypothetical protein
LASETKFARDCLLQRRVVRTPVQTSKLRASWGWARLKLPLPSGVCRLRKKGAEIRSARSMGCGRSRPKIFGDEEDGEGSELPVRGRGQPDCRHFVQPASVSSRAHSGRVGRAYQPASEQRRTFGSGRGLPLGRPRPYSASPREKRSPAPPRWRLRLP